MADNSLVYSHSESSAQGPIPSVWLVKLYHGTNFVGEFVLGRANKIKRKNGNIASGCTWYTGRMCNMGGWKLSTSMWANKYKVSPKMSLEESLGLYEQDLYKNGQYQKLSLLQGHVLGCFCPVEGRSLSQILAKPICHNEILLRAVFYLWYNHYSAKHNVILSYDTVEIPFDWNNKTN